MMRIRQSAIIRYFALKSPFFMSLGASRLKRVALWSALLVAASFILLSCGSTKRAGPPSGLTTRVFASQSVASPGAFPGLIIINGQYDTIARARAISSGAAPGLMAISPDRSSLLVFDSSNNSVQVVNTTTESSNGSIQLPGSTTSILDLASGAGYVAVPSAPLNTGAPPGAVVVLNLSTGSVTATVSIPGAQTVVSNPAETQLLVFSNDSDSLTIMSPLLVNTGSTVTTTVPGFDRPAYAAFSADGSTAYVLNCGPECGSASASASVQTLNMATLAVGAPVAVDGATIGWLSGSTLYVAGTPTAAASNSAPNNSCASENTNAEVCGRLDLIDVGSMTLTGSAVITDGYHDRIDMSINGQLFIGSHTCTNIGDVDAPTGEVRGCLSIYNTANGTVVIPPDNGDVTGLQSFTTRYVEYVAEGGNLRVYDTLIDSLIPPNDYIETGTIITTGVIIDVKAVDFF
jgi:DNA-binding beta-propeller fold protein YncE